MRVPLQNKRDEFCINLRVFDATRLQLSFDSVIEENELFFYGVLSLWNGQAFRLLQLGGDGLEDGEVFGDAFDLELILYVLVNNGLHALDHKVLTMPELHQPEKCLELGLLV